MSVLVDDSVSYLQKELRVVCFENFGDFLVVVWAVSVW